MKRSRVLVVDDNSAVRDELSSDLTKLGFQVQTSASGNEALESSFNSDIIISDVLMKNGTGIDLLIKLRARGNQIPFYFFSEAMRLEEETAFLLGANGCYHKSEKRRLYLEALKAVIGAKDESFLVPEKVSCVSSLH